MKVVNEINTAIKRHGYRWITVKYCKDLRYFTEFLGLK